MIELEKKEKEMIQALFTDFLREQPLSVVSRFAQNVTELRAKRN